MNSKLSLCEKIISLPYLIATNAKQPAVATAMTYNHFYTNSNNNSNDADRTAASLSFSCTSILPPVKEPIMQQKKKTLLSVFLVTMALLLVSTIGFSQSPSVYTGKKGITISSHPVSGPNSESYSDKQANVDLYFVSTAYTDKYCSSKGTITIVYNGGTGPYTVNVAGPSGNIRTPNAEGLNRTLAGPYTTTINGLDEGNYTVYVTDGTPTTISQTFNIQFYSIKNNNSGFFYTTIQSAVNAASSGDVLESCARNYTESVNINKSLTINGPNKDVSCSGSRSAEAVITGTGGYGNAAVTISADGVTLNGFTVSNPTGSFGVAQGGRSNTSVKYNIITNVGNATNGSGSSFGIQYEDDAAASNVSYTYNCINNIRGGQNGCPSGSNGSGVGIGFTSSASSATLTGLTVSYNTISNVSACNYNGSGGKGAYGVLIGVGASSTGSLSGAVISYNTIDNLSGRWAHAIGMEGKTPNAQVLNNDIKNLTGAGGDAIGVYFEDNNGAASTVVNNNSFTGTMKYGVAVNPSATGPVNATCNWYGAADATSVTAKVSGNLTYSPWLTSGGNSASVGFAPTGTCAGTGPVRNVTKGTYYTTIQDAVNSASANDNLELLDNITEALTSAVNVKITFNGNGKTITTSGNNYLIQFNAAGSTFENVKINKSDNLDQNILYVGGNNITIDGVDMTGTFNIGDGQVSRGLEVAGTDGLTVKNSSFKHLRQAAYINNVTNTVIQNNYLDNSKGWVVVASAHVTFTGNTWGSGGNANATDIAIIDDSPTIPLANVYFTCTVMKQIAANNSNPKLTNALIDPASCIVTNVTRNTWFNTIQGAIDDAATQNGDVIEAAAGTYTDVILINKQLTLKGANAGKSCGDPTRGAESIIDLGVTGLTPISLADNGGSSNVTIDGFEITGSMSNYAIYSGSTGNDNIAIKNNNIHDIGTNRGSGNIYAYAFHVGATNRLGVSITDNCITKVGNITSMQSGKGSAGIWFGQSNANGVVSNIEVKRNKISKIYSTSGAASGIDLVAAWGVGTGGLNAPVVTNNNISETQGKYGFGIQLDGKVPGAIISNNWLDNISGSSSAMGISIPASNNGAGTIVINNNSFTNMSKAIVSVNSAITSATCNWYGAADATSVTAKVSGNLTYSPWLTSGGNSASVGFDPTGTCNGTPVVLGSVTKADILCGQTLGSINVSWTSGVAPYTVSWTGTASGSTSNATSTYTITGLAAGSYTITVTDANGSTATSGTLTIQYTPVHNTTQGTYYTTIQGAVTAAAASDVIEVCAGTYSELLTIDKALTLKGAKFNVDPRPSVGSSRVIDAASETIVTGTKAQTLVTIKSDNVLIDGFEFKQTGTGNANAINSYSNYKNVTLSNNIVFNTGGGNAMRLYGGDNFLVEKNYLQDIGGEGIVLRNGNNQATPAINQKIKNNDVKNVNGVAGGAINVYGEKDLEITGNIIETMYQGISIGATGPAYYDMNNINVHHNTVYSKLNQTGGSVARFALQVNGLGTGVNVHHNILAQSGMVTTTYPLIRVGYDADPASASNPTGLSISNNSLSMVSGSSGKYMLIGANISNSITATCNWWSSNNAATIAAEITDLNNVVTYSPWLTSGGNSASVGFDPTGTCNGTPVVLGSVTKADILCGQTSGSIAVSWTDGVAPYTVSWTGGGSTSGLPASPNTITDLAAGTYTVTVTDANGSTATSGTLTIQYTPVHNTTKGTYYTTIQGAINDANATGDVIEVCEGTYTENVNITKSVTLHGAAGYASIVSAPIGNTGATMRVSAAGVVIDGFKITREGNNVTDWNSTLSAAGIAIQSQGNYAEVKNSWIYGNRSGIDVNNSNDNNIHNNLIEKNHTGIIFRNQTDNTKVKNNFIQDNRTVGVLFLDGSIGTNNPVQQALNSNFNENYITGNWYGQIVDRQSGGSLPAPGTNMKNFECNWYGSTLPLVSTNNSGEPGYTSLIPTYFGGGATAPGGQPQILGPASANFDYQPWLNNGTDNDLSTLGFQPVPGSCNGTPVVLGTITPTGETCAKNDGKITVNWTGGVANYTVSWSGNASGSTNSLTASTYTITGLAAGTYTVTVTDANGSTATSGTVTVQYTPVHNTTQGTYYTTIQGAVTAAAASDVIEVCAGTYAENVVVNKSLDIRGPNYGVNPNSGGRGAEAIITYPDGSDGGELFIVRADNVKVDGFSIDGQNNVTASGSIGFMGYGDNISVTNNIISNFNYVSVWFTSYHPDYPTPSDGNFYRNGIVIDKNHIQNSSIFGQTNGSIIGYGIYMQGAYGSVTNNVVEGTKDAIQVQPYEHPNTGNVTGLVSNNDLQGYRTGIWYNAGGMGVSPVATHWEIKNNNMVGIAPPPSTTVTIWGGLRVSAYEAGTLKFNENSVLQSSANAGSYQYIYSDYGTNKNFDANCNWYGSATAGTIATRITAANAHYIPWLVNGVDNNTATGFQPVPGSCNGTPVVLGTITPTGETCAKNDGKIDVNWTDGVANYIVSWTGTASGSTNSLTASPYTITGLAAGTYTVTVTDANGSTASSSTLTIQNTPVHNTTKGTYYTTIQGAINDANATGDVIEVCAGTYAENVVVNKEVTILGPNANVDPCSGSRVAEAIVVPATSAVGTGEIFHVKASNVTIKGFTIDGDNTTLTSGVHNTTGADMDAAEGITNYEAGVNNLTVSNNIIQNLSYFGVTLFGNSYSANATTGSTISNNKIQNLGTYDDSNPDPDANMNFWGGGVLLYNNQYAAVSNNCMTNVRLGVQTGNFSRANTGANTYQVISNNSIETRRTGIFHNLFYSLASPFTLSNNTITALGNANETKWTGIALASMQATTSTASGNSINGSGTNVSQTMVEGIDVWNCQVAPLISGGTISNVKLGINVNNYEGYYNSNAGNTSATIDGVNISSVGDAGIKVHDNPANSNNATVAAEIKNSTISNSGSGTGIWVVGSDATANIHDNVNTITGFAIGVDVDGSAATIYRNKINANGTGVRVTNSGKLTSVTENFITNNTGDGILVTATANTANGTSAINTNDLSGNGGKSINNQSATTLANASCNWYGSLTPAVVVTKVSGPVTYSPYLTNGTDADASTNGFQNNSCRTVVEMDPSITQVTITDLSDNLVDAHQLPFNSINRVHVSILNNDQSNPIPSGTTKIRLDLGDKMIVNPGFNLATAPLKDYFNWTQTTESGHVVIYGDQIADLHEDFSGDAIFETLTTAVGTSVDDGTWQITNHNNNTYYLIDGNLGNNNAAATYTVLSPLVITLNSKTDVKCNGDSNGSITVSASGGATPYQFSIDGGNTWLPNGGTSSPYTFNDLTANTYTVKVKDNVGSITTLSPDVEIKQPSVLSATISAQTNVSCHGGINGSATVTAGGGTYPYTYLWSNGQTSVTATGLAAGTYTVTVTDDHGCTTTASATITEPPVLTATTSVTNVSCHGGSNGSATVTAVGGTSPYTYLWSNGQTSVTATSLAQGTYSVTVTDANGCTATASATITEPDVLNVTASGTNVTCNGNGDGTAAATVSGGTQNYTYAWAASLGGIVPPLQINNVSLTGLVPGTYTVTVNDANGCGPVTASYTVTQPNVLQASNPTLTHITCAGSPTGTATVTATGGTAPYSFSIDGGAYVQNGGVFTALAAGAHSVLVKDANGCTYGLVSFTILQPTNPDVSIGSQVTDNLFPTIGSENMIMYNLKELLGKAATPATIRIFKPSGYIVSFDNTLTNISFGGPTYTLDNPNWTITNDAAGYVEYSRTGHSNQIDCNELVRIAFKLKRNTTNVSNFNFTAQFRQATGEVILTNNNNSINMTGQ